MTIVKVLKQTFKITKDGVKNTLEVQIKGYERYFKIGDNEIMDGGTHVLYFEPYEDPLEDLYYARIFVDKGYERINTENVKFSTKRMFEIYHPGIDETILTGLTEKQAAKIAEESEYKDLEIYQSNRKYVSGKLIQIIEDEQ